MSKYRCPICGKIYEKENIVFGNKHENKWKYENLKKDIKYSFICRDCHSNIYYHIKRYDKYLKYILLLHPIICCLMSLTWLIGLFGNETTLYNIFSFVISPITNSQIIYDIQYPIAWFFTNLLFALVFIISFRNFYRISAKIVPCFLFGVFIFGAIHPTILNEFLSIFRFLIPFVFLIISSFGTNDLRSFLKDRLELYESLGYSLKEIQSTILDEVRLYQATRQEFDSESEVSMSSYDDQEIFTPSNNADGGWFTGLGSSHIDNDKLEREREAQYQRQQEQQRYQEEQRRRQKEASERQRANFQKMREDTERRNRERLERQHTIAYAKQYGSSVQVYNPDKGLIFSRSGSLEGYTSSSVTISYKSGKTQKTFRVYDNYGRQINCYTQL